MKKWWNLAFLLQVNFDNRKRVSWYQLMFHIKRWIFVTIKIPLFHMYNTFECHFKPNHKIQSDMVDPVWKSLQMKFWYCFEFNKNVHLTSLVVKKSNFFLFIEKCCYFCDFHNNLFMTSLITMDSMINVNL